MNFRRPILIAIPWGDGAELKLRAVRPSVAQLMAFQSAMQAGAIGRAKAWTEISAIEDENARQIAAAERAQSEAAEVVETAQGARGELYGGCLRAYRMPDEDGWTNLDAEGVAALLGDLDTDALRLIDEALVKSGSLTESQGNG